MEILKFHAINCLGTWEYSYNDEDLSTIKFWSEGQEVSAPADFPSEADINARQADMQTKADTGNYNSVQEIITTY